MTTSSNVLKVKVNPGNPYIIVRVVQRAAEETLKQIWKKSKDAFGDYDAPNGAIYTI